MKRNEKKGTIADRFFNLRLLSSEVRVKERTGEIDEELSLKQQREIDLELAYLLIEALKQSRDGSRKLHPAIANHLVNIIEGGLAGKLPYSWPEPSGGRDQFEETAGPEDVAVLYKTAGEKQLLSQRNYAASLCHEFGISRRTLHSWAAARPASIRATGDGGYILACHGLTVYVGTLDLLRSTLADLLANAVSAYLKV
ncbi:MAG TPA: hypothetical protein VHL31_19800 [Geminicoccus sp.]|jgi:hypothetical protein|uniref:hypothetical protein n=1 Tax=Geminicoccus sp. TaxID=2024832 RepID=UPI002E2EF8BB|nr:hypothetical protein [Geminicoccus sp.]HEX2528527.1 hypothetical protein [Geminicoccus sp.]